MRSLYAFAFKTDRTLVQMAAQLQQGPWQWIERDGDRWGDYLSTIAVPGAMVKLFVDEPEPGSCAVNVRFESDAVDASDQDRGVRETLLATVLPSIGARDVTEIEYLE